VSLGLTRRDNILVCDIAAWSTPHARRWTKYKARYAARRRMRTLADAMDGRRCLPRPLRGGVLSPRWLRGWPKPLIFALANPTPEILPEACEGGAPDAMIATGRSDYPNQVNNVLCFPFIFRGALDCGATEINEAMKRACVKAIADLARRSRPISCARPMAARRCASARTT
jgi:malate dehydrogenase (oxaloacetate-decarboxylating)(NADP+)